MITLPQVKMLAKQNNISFTGLNKDEIIALLIDKNIIKTSDIFKQKIVVKNKMCQNNSEQNNKYSYLKGIRTNPKKVEVFDLQTRKRQLTLLSIRQDVRLVLIRCILMTVFF